MKQTNYKPTLFLKKIKGGNTPQSPVEFITNQKTIYHQQLEELELSLRFATMNDREVIMNLRNERFTVPNSYSTHWLYHLLNYGSCVLIENKEKDLVGYKFEATYANDLTVSFTAGTAVKAEYSHLGLGKLLIGYSHLIAMEKGAKVNRGIIDVVNYPSVHNFINHFGGIFIDFEPHFKNYGARLIYEIPLDDYTPNQRQIDFQAIEQYISEHEEGKDYQMLDCGDVEGIEDMYNGQIFKIIALLPKAFMASGRERYFAIPI